MTFLVQSIEQAIQAHRLLRSGQGLLVAVSGGLDSMVLLRVLHSLSAKHDWRLAVGHFNHQLRGRSSDADEALVRRTAGKLRLKLVSGRGDVRAFQRREKISLEMAARQLRHQFLAEAARELALDTIALAHHADDQVELFFLRLLRGAGGAGLAGMKWSSRSPVDTGVRLVRPLLGVAKPALAEFARAEKVRFREDASNSALDIQRNRIRHELLPLLRNHYQPALDRTTTRTMDILGANAEFVETVARAWRSGKRDGFEKLHVAVQRSYLQSELFALGIDPDYDLIESLRVAAGRIIAIKPGKSVMRDEAGRIHVQAVPKPADATDEMSLELIEPRGRTRFGGVTISWNIRADNPSPSRTRGPRPDRELFDADKVGSPITLRHWRAGDRLQPIGMTKSVKLQDLFTNQKVPRHERHRCVVAVTAAGEIFWVEGLRIAERCKLGPETIRAIEWRWRRSAGQS